MAINSLSASSKGFAGLASGMDTESMVKKLLSGTQSKIDRQEQKKTQLTYKQGMYRGITSKLKTLQQNFFSFVNPSTNLLSDGFFNTMTAKSTSSAYRVTGTSLASAGSTKIDRIEQLAKAASMKSPQTVSGQLTGTFSEDALDRFKLSMEGKLVVTVGEESKTINIRSLAGMGSQEAQDQLNKLLTAEGIDAKATFINGKFTFESSNGKPIKIKADGAGAVALMGSSSELSNDKGKITTALNTDAMMPTIDITLDGVKKTIHFDPYNAGGVATADAAAASLQSAIAKAHGGGVTVTAQGNKLQFATTSASRQIQISGNTSSLDIIGIASGQSNKINTNISLNKQNFADKLIGDEFRFSINGVDFNITADRSLTSIISEINNSKANVKISYVGEEDRFTMVSTVSGKDSDIVLNQKQGNLLTSMFGAAGASGASSKDLSGARITLAGGDSFTSMGGTFKLKINGSTETFNIPPKDNGKPYTSRELIDALNLQMQKSINNNSVNPAKAAGVRFTYDPVTSEVVMSANPGQDVEVLRGTDNSLITKLSASGGDFEVKLNNANIKLNIPPKPDGTAYTQAELVQAINDAAAGNAELTAAGVTFAYDTAQKDIVPTATGTNTISVIKPPDDSLLMTMGFKGGEFTLVKSDSTLEELGIKNDITLSLPGGNDINITKGMTLDGLMRVLQASLEAQYPPGMAPADLKVEFDQSSSKFRISGVSIPVDIKVSGDDGLLFGSDTLSFNKPTSLTPDDVTIGQNAKLVINGVDIERNSNSFTFNGLQFELQTTTQKLDDAGNPVFTLDPVTGQNVPVYETPSTIEVTRDTEKIFEGIIKFVDAYNEIITEINKLTSADPTYKEYPPLTGEEKQALSDREIELWEEKSQEGLLRGDTILYGVSSDLRNQLYQKSSESTLALFDLGITTSMYTEKETAGKLMVVPDRLRAAINEKPDEVRKLFATAEDGLAVRLNKAIDRAVSSDSLRTGTLVREAGSPGISDTKSSIYKQIKEIKLNLIDLERRYKSEYTRYWRQFTSMEKTIQSMNQQSSWLAQQFSS